VVEVVVVVVVVRFSRLLDTFLNQRTCHASAWIAHVFLENIPEAQSKETVGFGDYYVPLALRNFNLHK
jgi:hypothetical protein